MYNLTYLALNSLCNYQYSLLRPNSRSWTKLSTKISLSDHQTFSIFWCHAWMAFEGRFSSVSCADTRCLLNALPSVQFSSFVTQFSLESSRKDHHNSSLSATFHWSLNKKSADATGGCRFAGVMSSGKISERGDARSARLFYPGTFALRLCCLALGETWRNMERHGKRQRRPSLTFSCLCVCVEIGTVCSFHRRVLDEWPGMST